MSGSSISDSCSIALAGRELNAWEGTKDDKIQFIDRKPLDPDEVLTIMISKVIQAIH